MIENVTSNEDLIRLGEPIKKLSGIKGFNDLPDIKGTLLPFKKLTEMKGFEELSKSENKLNDGGKRNA